MISAHQHDALAADLNTILILITLLNNFYVCKIWPYLKTAVCDICVAYNICKIIIITIILYQVYNKTWKSQTNAGTEMWLIFLYLNNYQYYYWLLCTQINFFIIIIFIIGGRGFVCFFNLLVGYQKLFRIKVGMLLVHSNYWWIQIQMQKYLLIPNRN